MRALQSSMHQKVHVKSSNPCSIQSKPPFDTSQRSTPLTNAAEEQQRKVMQGRFVPSQQQQRLLASQQPQRSQTQQSILANTRVPQQQ